jgi:hypothetical protein
MGIKIHDRPAFTVPVSLAGLDEPLTVRFRRLPLTERMRWLEGLRADLGRLEAAPADAEAPISDTERTSQALDIKAKFLMHFVEDWSGVDDAEFGEDALRALLDAFDDAFDAISAAYRDGGTAATLGNSKPSPADGPAAAAA